MLGHAEAVSRWCHDRLGGRGDRWARLATLGTALTEPHAVLLSAPQRALPMDCRAPYARTARPDPSVGAYSSRNPSTCGDGPRAGDRRTASPGLDVAPGRSRSVTHTGASTTRMRAYRRRRRKPDIQSPGDTLDHRAEQQTPHGKVVARLEVAPVVRRVAEVFA